MDWRNRPGKHLSGITSRRPQMVRSAPQGVTCRRRIPIATARSATGSDSTAGDTVGDDADAAIPRSGRPRRNLRCVGSFDEFLMVLGGQRFGPVRAAERSAQNRW